MTSALYFEMLFDQMGLRKQPSYLQRHICVTRKDLFALIDLLVHEKAFLKSETIDNHAFDNGGLFVCIAFSVYSSESG